MTVNPGTHRVAPRGSRAMVAARRRGVIGRSRRPDPPPLDAWERLGRAAYALACALLGDESRAARVVTLAMAEVDPESAATSAYDARRTLARHVYWRSQELSDARPDTPGLPPMMVRLGQLAELQRTCLALCVFGGHTHRETAGLIGVPPLTVARAVTSGLKELGLAT